MYLWRVRGPVFLSRESMVLGHQPSCFPEVLSHGAFLCCKGGGCDGRQCLDCHIHRTGHHSWYHNCQHCRHIDLHVMILWRRVRNISPVLLLRFAVSQRRKPGEVIGSYKCRGLFMQGLPGVFESLGYSCTSWPCLTSLVHGNLLGKPWGR